MNVSFLVLAGGKSSRMNYKDKSSLRYDKNRDFLQKILCETQKFQEIIISKNEEIEKERLHYVDKFLEKNSNERIYKVIKDKYWEVGPIGGLASGFEESTNPYIFVVPCDIPNITKEFIEYVLGYLSSDYDAIIVKDANGKIHPLCGIYKKSILSKIYTQIGKEDFKVLNLLREIKIKLIDFKHTNFNLKTLLHNFNTIESLEKLKSPKIFAISGVKNSGKTTLIVKIIKYLKNLGFKVAAIKHDGHDFIGDVPESDTFRLKEAGASGTLIYSDIKFMLIKEGRYDISYYLNMFEEYDYIILEGFKNSKYPKFEIVRKNNSKISVAEKENLLGIITDIENFEYEEDIEKISLSDDRNVEKILEIFEK